MGTTGATAVRRILECPLRERCGDMIRFVKKVRERHRLLKGLAAGTYKTKHAKATQVLLYYHVSSKQLESNFWLSLLLSCQNKVAGERATDAHEVSLECVREWGDTRYALYTRTRMPQA